MSQQQIYVSDDSGDVILRFAKPVDWAKFSPDEAFKVGEAIARAAHKARFGEEAPSDGSYLGQQIRARTTEQVRDKMIARVALLLKNMQNGNKTPGYWALQIVDSILAEVG